MPIWLLLLPTVLYAAAILRAANWRRKPRPRPARPPDLELPRVAVLVAARDEAHNLPRCLDALLAQRYPPALLSIYVANDGSTDGTEEVVRARQATLRTSAAAEPQTDSPDLHLVSVPPEADRLRGKARAIHAAIEASSEEVLVMTDADCAPPPDWAQTLVTYLDDQTGVVTAEASVDRVIGRRLRDEIQALDWRYLLAGSAFLIESGWSITAMGNNMAFRRESYNAVGGYPALPFSVTEDHLLFRAIVRHTRLQARFPVDDRLIVPTLPVPTLRDAYRQRRRWARGGLRAGPGSYGLYAWAHLAHLLPLIALALAPAAAAITIVVKSGADYAMLRSATPPAEPVGLASFALWQAYLFGYACTLPASLLLAPRIKWKGRRL